MSVFPVNVWDTEITPTVTVTMAVDGLLRQVRLKGMAQAPRAGMDAVIGAMLADPARGRLVARYIAEEPEEADDLLDQMFPQLREKGMGVYNEQLHPRDQFGKFIPKAALARAARDPRELKRLQAMTTHPEERKKLHAAVQAIQGRVGKRGGGFMPEQVGKAVPGRQSVAETAAHIHRLRAEVGEGPPSADHLRRLAALLAWHSVAELRELKNHLGVQVSGDPSKETAVGGIAHRALTWREERMEQVKAQRARAALTARLKAEKHTGTDEHGREWEDGQIVTGRQTAPAMDPEEFERRMAGVDPRDSGAVVDDRRPADDGTDDHAMEERMAAGDRRQRMMDWAADRPDSEPAADQLRRAEDRVRRAGGGEVLGDEEPTGGRTTGKLGDTGSPVRPESVPARKEVADTPADDGTAARVAQIQKRLAEADDMDGGNVTAGEQIQLMKELEQLTGGKAKPAAPAAPVAPAEETIPETGERVSYHPAEPQTRDFSSPAATSLLTSTFSGHGPGSGGMGSGHRAAKDVVEELMAQGGTPVERLTKRPVREGPGGSRRREIELRDQGIRTPDGEFHTLPSGLAYDYARHLAAGGEKHGAGEKPDSVPARKEDAPVPADRPKATEVGNDGGSDESPRVSDGGGRIPSPVPDIGLAKESRDRLLKAHAEMSGLASRTQELWQQIVSQHANKDDRRRAAEGSAEYQQLLKDHHESVRRFDQAKEQHHELLAGRADIGPYESRIREYGSADAFGKSLKEDEADIINARVRKHSIQETGESVVQKIKNSPNVKREQLQVGDHVVGKHGEAYRIESIKRGGKTITATPLLNDGTEGEEVKLPDTSQSYPGANPSPVGYKLIDKSLLDLAISRHREIAKTTHDFLNQYHGNVHSTTDRPIPASDAGKTTPAHAANPLADAARQALAGGRSDAAFNAGYDLYTAALRGEHGKEVQGIADRVMGEHLKNPYRHEEFLKAVAGEQAGESPSEKVGGISDQSNIPETPDSFPAAPVAAAPAQAEVPAAAETKAEHPHVKDRHVDDYFNDLHGKDMQHPKFLAMPKEEQEERIRNTKARLREVLEKQAKRITDKDMDLLDSSSLQPENKHSRRLFEEITGQKLPAGKKATDEAVKQYLGTDRLAARESQQQADADAEAKAEHAKKFGPHHSDNSFMAGSTAHAQAKMVEHLNGLLRSEGAVKPMHAHVEDWVARGGKPKIKTYEWEGRKVRGERQGGTKTEPAIEHPDGSWSVVSKTAHDYAQHLIDGGQSRTHDKEGPPATVDTPTPAPAEPAQSSPAPDRAGTEPSPAASRTPRMSFESDKGDEPVYPSAGRGDLFDTEGDEEIHEGPHHKAVNDLLTSAGRRFSGTQIGPRARMEDAHGELAALDEHLARQSGVDGDEDGFSPFSSLAASHSDLMQRIDDGEFDSKDHEFDPPSERAENAVALLDDEGGQIDNHAFAGHPDHGRWVAQNYRRLHESMAEGIKQRVMERHAEGGPAGPDKSEGFNAAGMSQQVKDALQSRDKEKAFELAERLGSLKGTQGDAFREAHGTPWAIAKDDLMRHFRHLEKGEQDAEEHGYYYDPVSKKEVVHPDHVDKARQTAAFENNAAAEIKNRLDTDKSIKPTERKRLESVARQHKKNAGLIEKMIADHEASAATPKFDPKAFNDQLEQLTEGRSTADDLNRGADMLSALPDDHKAALHAHWKATDGEGGDIHPDEYARSLRASASAFGSQRGQPATPTAETPAPTPPAADSVAARSEVAKQDGPKSGNRESIQKSLDESTQAYQEVGRQISDLDKRIDRTGYGSQARAKLNAERAKLKQQQDQHYAATQNLRERLNQANLEEMAASDVPEHRLVAKIRMSPTSDVRAEKELNSLIDAEMAKQGVPEEAQAAIRKDVADTLTYKPGQTRLADEVRDFHDLHQRKSMRADALRELEGLNLDYVASNRLRTAIYNGKAADIRQAMDEARQIHGTREGERTAKEAEEKRKAEEFAATPLGRAKKILAGGWRKPEGDTDAYSHDTVLKDSAVGRYNFPGAVSQGLLTDGKFLSTLPEKVQAKLAKHKKVVENTKPEHQEDIERTANFMRKFMDDHAGKATEMPAEVVAHADIDGTTHHLLRDAEGRQARVDGHYDQLIRGIHPGATAHINDAIKDVPVVVYRKDGQPKAVLMSMGQRESMPEHLKNPDLDNLPSGTTSLADHFERATPDDGVTFGKEVTKGGKKEFTAVGGEGDKRMFVTVGEGRDGWYVKHRNQKEPLVDGLSKAKAKEMAVQIVAHSHGEDENGPVFVPKDGGNPVPAGGPAVDDAPAAGVGSPEGGTPAPGTPVPAENQANRAGTEKGGGETREPWQMTKDEFHAQKRDEMKRQYPQLEGERLESATRPHSNKHGQLVQAAAARGERIPDNVLNSDPDLRNRVLHDYPDAHADYLPPEVAQHQKDADKAAKQGRRESREREPAQPDQLPDGQKHPWQMTKAEHDKHVEENDPQVQKIRRELEQTKGRDRKLVQDRLDREISGKKFDHSTAVGVAVDLGRDVPPEVLADYPHLATPTKGSYADKQMKQRMAELPAHVQAGLRDHPGHHVIDSDGTTHTVYSPTGEKVGEGPHADLGQTMGDLMGSGKKVAVLDRDGRGAEEPAKPAGKKKGGKAAVNPEAHRVADKLAKRVVGDIARNGFTTDHLDFAGKFGEMEDADKKAVVKELHRRGLLSDITARQRKFVGSAVAKEVAANAERMKRDHEMVPTNRHVPFHESDAYRKAFGDDTDDGTTGTPVPAGGPKGGTGGGAADKPSGERSPVQDIEDEAKRIADGQADLKNQSMVYQREAKQVVADHFGLPFDQVNVAYPEWEQLRNRYTAETGRKPEDGPLPDRASTESPAGQSAEPAAGHPEVDHSEQTEGGSTIHHLKAGDGLHVVSGPDGHELRRQVMGAAPGGVFQSIGRHDTLEDAIAAAGRPAGSSPTETADTPLTATPADPNAPYTLAEHDATVDRLHKGEITPDDLRSAHSRLQQHRDAIHDELKKRTVPELKKLAGHWRASDMKKPELLKYLHERLGEDLIPYNSDARMITIGGDYDPIKEQAARLSEVTPEKIKTHADRMTAALEERKKRVAELKESVANPKTLEDYQRLARSRGGLDKLTPEELERHDELHAEARRGRSMAERQEKAKVAGFSGGEQAAGGIGIVQGHHQKRGVDTHTVTVENRLGDEKFQEALSAAKRLGGSYVNAMIAKRYGATPGFQFFDKAKAEQFAAVLRGESVDRSADVAGEMADRLANRAGTVAEKADSLIGQGEESLGRERRSNTRRQAEMAASAEAAAREKIATGQTLRRIADGQADGTLKHLNGVRSAEDLHTLERALRFARYERMRQAKGPDGAELSYREREALQHEPHGLDDFPHLEYPHPSAHQSELQDIAKMLADEPGLKRFAEKMKKEGDPTKDVKFSGTVGGMKANGGVLMYDHHFRDHPEYKYIAHHMRGDGEGDKAVRVHYSKDWRLAQATEKQGERWLGGFYTADKGKSWATNREDAVTGAIRRGNALDHIDAPREKSVKFTDPDDIEALRTAARKLRNHPNDRLRRIGQSLKEKLEHHDRLKRADIHSLPELRAAIREYLPLQKAADAEDPVKKAERELKGRDIPGFFPTPRPAVEEMLDRADIQPGHTVLEPSAGKGDILDAIRERHPDAQTHALEYNSALRDILQKKGHNVVGHDALDHVGQYDRIVMNPPFESRADAKHTRHAYENNLAPGGRMVAIMSEGPFSGSQKADQEFREWLESVGGVHEPMPEGSFAGNDAFRKTGVRTRMVTIDKPE